MQIYKLSKSVDLKKVMKELNVDSAGISIMGKKSTLNFFYIKNIYCGASNILKQDALSIGAELAVPHGGVDCSLQYHNAVLICNDKQLEILANKEKAQPFKLKYLASFISQYKNRQKTESNPKIMGVINANDDSFFNGSRFKGDEAIQHIEKMIEEGADIIDIGGVSSRPGSEYCGEDEELRRVRPIIKKIYEMKLYEKMVFSIDSFNPKVIDLALSSGFKIVNDITGLANDEVAKVSGKYDAKVCIMHIKGTPKEMQNKPFYEDVILEVDNYFQKRIEKAHKYGINNIILDVGIGFGKRLEDNLKLIKHLEHFKRFGYELLIGASRKSMIDAIIPTPVENRLSGSLAIHLKSIQNGANIIRCHDVAEHKQAIEVAKAIDEIV
jgi:dihydropteroate synthase